MEYPLVTIYTLTYKRFDNIYKNLESTFNQSYGNIELIISDDGSDNFPREDIHNFIEKHRRANIKRIIILQNEENVGTVKNLNKALTRASGVLYVPLSQDDTFFSNNVVEKIVQRYMKKKFNILITSRYGVNKSGEFQRFWPHVKARTVIDNIGKKQVAKVYCFYTEIFLDYASGSVMNFSADFFKKVGPFDERYKLWEDGPFIHKCLRLGYQIDTAYDIIAIRYEQTEGVSSSLSARPEMTADMQLYNNTDLKFSLREFGLLHFRTMTYINKMSRYDSKIKRFFLRLLYLDVFFLKSLKYSDKIRKWSEFDDEESEKVKKQGE